MLVVQLGGNGSGFEEQNTCPLPHDGTVSAERYTPLQSVLVLYSTCTGLNGGMQLEPSVLPSDLSQPQKTRFGEWWMQWEPCLWTLVRVSCTFQGQSNSHRLWAEVT